MEKIPAEYSASMGITSYCVGFYVLLSHALIFLLSLDLSISMSKFDFKGSMDYKSTMDLDSVWISWRVPFANNKVLMGV